MLIPADLREQARRYREAAVDERTPPLKRYLANHALALAQLAERIEHERIELSQHTKD